jgi:hypothetical protein
MLFQPPADLTDKGTNFISRIALLKLPGEVHRRFSKVQISRKGRRIRCYERIAAAKAECSNYGVNLRSFQNFLFEQLFRNLMEQAKIGA